MFRELASLFSITKESKYGLITRILVNTALIIYALLIVIRGLHDITYVSIATFSVFIVIAILLAMDGRLKNYLNGLKVIFLFVFLGALFYVFSYFTGIGPKSLIQVILGVEKTALLIFPFTLAASWFTPYEVSYVLERMGLCTAALILRSALSKLPLLFIDISEATHTIKLKYGARKTYKAIYYLLFESMLLGNAYYEAYYIYGLPLLKVDLVKNCKLEAYAVFLTLSALVILFMCSILTL